MTTTKPTAEPTTPAAGVTYVEFMEQASDATIQSLVDTQTATLAAIKQAFESVPNPVEYPVLAAPALPTLREVVESNLAFADKFLANQKAYAAKVLELYGA